MVETWTASADLPPNERAPMAARRLLDGLLTSWHQEQRRADAHLIVSEMVGNAVRHAGEYGTLRLELQGNDSCLLVSLADGSPDRPRTRAATGSDESGRGLQIVEHLTACWGIEELPQGKRVWAKLTEPSVVDEEHVVGA